MLVCFGALCYEHLASNQDHAVIKGVEGVVAVVTSAFLGRHDTQYLVVSVVGHGARNCLD